MTYPFLYLCLLIKYNLNLFNTKIISIIFIFYIKKSLIIKNFLIMIFINYINIIILIHKTVNNIFVNYIKIRYKINIIIKNPLLNKKYYFYFLK